MATIDNRWYDALGDDWWSPTGAVAALHEATPVRLEYFLARIGDPAGCRILDLGCGGGLLSEPLARLRARVVGLDPSRPSLIAGRRHAQDQDQLAFVHGAGEALPFADGSFDAVIAADSLEHVEDWPIVVAEAARVLRPDGWFLFDTINRTWRSRLVMLWGAQTLLRFAPAGTHTFDRFIRPADLRQAAEAAELVWHGTRGLSFRRRPLRAAWSYRRTRRLGGFRLSDDLAVSYLGAARKPA